MRIRMKHIYLALLFFLVEQTILIAKPDTAQFLHFDLDNGFPSNNVYSLVQDRFGCLWFATDNGVVKYNGYTLEVFNTTDGLPSNDVYQLYPDKTGRIWLNSISYQFGYIKDDKYHGIKLRIHDRIFKAYNMADNGKYFFLTFWERNYFFLAIIEDDLEVALPIYYNDVRMSGPESRQGQSKSILRGAYIDDSCRLYMQKWDNAIYRYDLLNPGRKFRQLCAPIDDEYLSMYLGGSRQQDDEGNIYSYRPKGDMLLFDNLHNCTHTFFAFDATAGEYIYTLLFGRNTGEEHNYTIVISNYFLYKFDRDFNLVSKDSLSSVFNARSQLAFVFTDTWQNKWFTTTSNGVWCQSGTTIFNTDDSLTAIHQAKFVGSFKNGTTFWWDKEQLIFYKLPPGGVPVKINLPYYTGITNIVEVNDTFAYMTLKDGIFSYNKYSGKIASIFKNYKKVSIAYEGHLKHDAVNTVAQAIFFGGHFAIRSFSKNEFFTVGINGLHIYRHDKDSFSCNVITDERFTNITYDSMAHLVIAYNHQKVLVYQPSTGKNFTLDDHFLKSFGINSILNIEIDKFHNYVLLSDNDVFIFNPLLSRFARINTPLDLHDGMIHLYDNKLCIAGPFGLALASVNGPFSFSKAQFWPNINNYNRINDFVIDDSGRALLSTDKGFYKIGINTLPLGYKSGSFGFFRLMLKTSSLQELHPKDTFLFDQKLEKIGLEAVNLYGKGAPAYTYRIEGVSNDWQKSDGDIYIGRLHPGKYYRIDYSVADNIWTSGQHSIFVYRIPYWWQTTVWLTFFWITGLIIVAVLVLVIILITRRIIARGNEKKRALTELELKAIYSQINPHFIFNTLNAAQFFINKKRFDDAYTHVSKFSQLLRAYLKSSQDRYITLEDEIQMLKNYIELQQIRFEEKFDYKLEVENKIPVNSIKIPSLLLQPLVENAINHGLFHKESGGMLILKFLQGANNTELLCIIEDNGVGRERSAEIKKQDSTRKESYGTRLTQQLIDIYREYEKMDIYLEYTDKTAPETGTIVTLTIKNVKYVA